MCLSVNNDYFFPVVFSANGKRHTAKDMSELPLDVPLTIERKSCRLIPASEAEYGVWYDELDGIRRFCKTTKFGRAVWLQEGEDGLFFIPTGAIPEELLQYN